MHGNLVAMSTRDRGTPHTSKFILTEVFLEVYSFFYFGLFSHWVFGLRGF